MNRLTNIKFNIYVIESLKLVVSKMYDFKDKIN